jgi:hypothetical protein
MAVVTSLLKEKLSRSYRQFYALRLPKELHKLDLPADMDVDFYEEDAYLAGLASSFLKRGTLTQVSEIRLRKSIDRSIDEVKAETPSAKEALKKIKAYRAKMIELAELVSRASGIPIVDFKV